MDEITSFLSDLANHPSASLQTKRVFADIVILLNDRRDMIARAELVATTYEDPGARDAARFILGKEDSLWLTE